MVSAFIQQDVPGWGKDEEKVLRTRRSVYTTVPLTTIMGFMAGKK